MEINNVFLGLIALAVLVLVGFIVYFLYELKRTLFSLIQCVETIENSVKATTEELQITLKSVEKLSNGVGMVTSDAKEFSESVREIGKSVKRVSKAVGMVTTMSVPHLSEVRAGVKAGLGYFIKNTLVRKKTKSSKEVTHGTAG